MGTVTGQVTRVSGPLVEATGMGDVAMSELVVIGSEELLGEIVAIRDGLVTMQAYEYTGGTAVGAPATALGAPLSATLGPDLLGGVYDGLLRPLSTAPTWLGPSVGAESPRTWSWAPASTVGTTVGEGDILGTVPEVAGPEYRVLVPPGVHGEVTWIAPPGRYHGDEPVARIAEVPVCLRTRWPIRRPRPVRRRLTPSAPLSTGQRVLDAVFPIAMGGSAAVPGGFGTGKTLLLQQIAKWCTADVIVYVGCGERGNEMADVLQELSQLSDPRTGRRLLDRTVIIANTSNMPVMARETSIYAGVTVAEHFRDMGHDAVVIADSTSRWAEALREFSARSGDLPAEEGYPASLAASIASFYERAGCVETLGGRRGSVTVIGAVSPPGGDITEPVTSHTERFVRAVWSLDRDLAYARHYPAVGWAGSFTRDTAVVAASYAHAGDPGWAARRARITSLLAEADRLQDLADLVGATTLPGPERVALLAGRLLREGMLQQSALSPNDDHCTPAKARALGEAILAVVDACAARVRAGVPAELLEMLDFTAILRAAADTGPDDADGVRARQATMLAALEEAR